MYFVSSCHMWRGRLHLRQKLMRGWISAGILSPCGPKLVKGRSNATARSSPQLTLPVSQRRDVHGPGQCGSRSHSKLLKEQVPAIHIDVATEVSKKIFRQQERCSSRHHTQYSIDTSNSNKEYGQSLAFQCLIVSNAEGHGLLVLDPLRAQTPSSCEQLFPLFEEYFVQSRSVRILYQSLPSQCNLA